MGRLVGLCIAAVWLTGALIVGVNRADLFGSGGISANIAGFTVIAIIAALLAFTVKELAKRWPEVMEERRRQGK